MNIETIDLDITPIIPKNLADNFHGALTLLKEFEKEIKWWFELYDETPHPQCLKIRKPIVIELYELACLLEKLNKKIETTKLKIQALFQQHGRDIALAGISRETRKQVTSDRIKLSPFRRQIAAHRYTDKKGDFITVGEAMKIYSKINDKELLILKDSLLKSLVETRIWLQDKRNTNYFGFLKDV